MALEWLDGDPAIFFKWQKSRGNTLNFAAWFLCRNNRFDRFRHFKLTSSLADYGWAKLDTMFFLHRDHAGSKFGFFVIIVEGVAAGRHSIARRCCAVAERPANMFAMQFAACRRIPEHPRVAQHHAAHPDQIDPAFA